MILEKVADGALISVDKLARELRTSKAEIGKTIGVSPESLSRKARLTSPATQSALRRLLEVLSRPLNS